MAKEFTVGLVFKNGERVTGKGKTKNEEQVEVKITLDRKPENWTGFFTDQDGTKDAIISELKIQGDDLTGTF